MGTDYGFIFCKIVNNNFERVWLKKDLNYQSSKNSRFGSRYSFLKPLFSDSEKIIQSLTSSPVKLDFFNNPTKAGYVSADEFLENYNKIISILKNNPDKFPFYYYFTIKDDSSERSPCLDSISVYIGKESAFLYSGWEYAASIHVSDREFSAKVFLEVFNFKELECCWDNYLAEKSSGRLLNEEDQFIGDKVIFVIKKQSLYDHFINEIDDMRDVILFAKDNHLLINGDIH